MTVPSSVEFFFDPICPWTWMTSRWLVGVAQERGVAVRWRNFSLAVVHADDAAAAAGPPEAVQQGVQRAHRVIAALVADGRDDLVGTFYTEWGRRVFHDRERPSPALVEPVAGATGAGAWAKAADEASWDTDVEASTREAQALVGPDVGSPVLALGDPRVGIFGPIVTTPPTGSAAAELFDHVIALAREPSFTELKRGRASGPQLGPRP